MEGINDSLSSSAGGNQSRKATLKKALFRHFRTSAHKNKGSRSNLLTKATAIARATGREGINVVSQSTQENNGVVRMRILVRKEDLERVLQIMKNNNNINNNKESCGDEDEEEASLLIEERVNQLHKKQNRRHNSWSPALQTIPEDILAC